MVSVVQTKTLLPEIRTVSLDCECSIWLFVKLEVFYSTNFPFFPLFIVQEEEKNYSEIIEIATLFHKVLNLFH